LTTAGLGLEITDADYAEVMDALLGDLAAVPWQRPYALPTATVFCTWRDAVGPGPLEQLRDLVLAGVDAEHRDHDYRAVTVGDLDACSIDGSLTRVPDTPANRQAFGSAGTADDSSPYPQQRDLRLSHASTRAALAVTSGPAGAAAGGGRDKGEAEQALLDKALEDYPHLFAPGRLWILDRNFPGVPRIQRMRAAGTHVLIRVKDGITLRRIGDFLPDGSYLAAISGGGITLTVRVIEYTVAVAGRDAPRAVLPDQRPGGPRRLPRGRPGRRLSLAVDRVGDLAEGSQVRISGAGPSTGAMLRSQSPAMVAQEHAAWVISTGLARATARAAAATAVPAGKGKRAGQPVHPREISFTAARRAIITTTRAGAATASLPAPALTASRGRVLAGLARRRVDVDRHRHRDRKTKARLGFPPGGPRIPAQTAAAQISICQPIAA